jgi:predicted RNA-binding protein with PIN domain
MELPAPISAALARGVAAYLRITPANEVPAKLRRFRSFRPQALAPHRAALIAALDDDELRSDILEWLNEGPHLKKDEARLLTIAAAREDGWESELSGEVKPAKPPAKSHTERLTDALEKEKGKVARLKEEARSAKASARDEVRAAKQLATEATAETKELRRRLRDAESETRSARDETQRVRRATEKELRALRREAEKALAAQKSAEERSNVSKREVAGLNRRIGQLESALADEKARAESARRRAAHPPRETGPRKSLKAPKGLLDDAPETLDRWLRTKDVHLVVDGYNAGMATRGFPGLELETMRNRLVDEASKLARRYSVRVTVVFDGAKVAPGIARNRKRGPVRIEYSAPDVIADDHIVEMLQKLPSTPVIVATNDRELQGRVAKDGATVATSDQLLAVLRGNLS